MKKMFVLTALLISVITTQAQNNYGLLPLLYVDHEIMKISATIFFVSLVMMFVLALLEKVLSYRIKNKIVDKGISDTLASSILQTNTRNIRPVTIKWFSILAGAGIGLIIVHYTQPLGIHSLAIMAFSIAASFLAYFYYLKQSGD